jgi:hypothetical protein
MLLVCFWGEERLATLEARMSTFPSRGAVNSTTPDFAVGRETRVEQSKESLLSKALSPEIKALEVGHFVSLCSTECIPLLDIVNLSRVRKNCCFLSSSEEWPLFARLQESRDAPLGIH